MLDLLLSNVLPKLPTVSIPFDVAKDSKLESPVMFELFTVPFTLIGISIFESSIELITNPLFDAKSSLANFSVLLPDSEMLELSNSNSIFVLEFVASDLV